MRPHRIAMPAGRRLCYRRAVSSESPQAELLPPEVLLAALQEPARPTLYLSEGFGPVPERTPGEEPEHVRALVHAREPFAAVQAAGARWLAAAEASGPGPLALVDAAELADPPASSRWSAVDSAARADLLGRGVQELLSLSPSLLLFRLTPRHGAHVLHTLRARLAAGEEIGAELVLLDHLVFAGITYWLQREPAEALVLGPASGPGWTLRPGFPRHASVWRRALARAPAQHFGGLALAGLAELVIVAALARRAGLPPRVQDPAIAAALRSAEAALGPRVIDILADGDRRASGAAN